MRCGSWWRGERLRHRRDPHAVRPVRRRRWPACGPTTWPRHALRALLDRSPALDPARSRRRPVRRRQRRRRGQPQRGADGRRCSPGCRRASRARPSTGCAARASRRRSRRRGPIETGDASIVVAGGVESMSRAPWVLLKPERGFPAGHETLHSTTLGWRMVNPEMPEQWTISLGESAEKLAGMLRRHARGRRTRSRCAATSAQRRVGRRASTTRGRPCAGRRPRARREHAPGHRRWSGSRSSSPRSSRTAR